MKKSILFSLALLAAAALSSCCKEGTGGEADITVHLMHHESKVYSLVTHPDTVFVKFNADELPGTDPSDFDTYFVGTIGEDHIHMNDLECGKYYLYAVGFDSAAATGYYRVKGGMGIKIKHKDRKDPQSITLSVTE